MCPIRSLSSEVSVIESCNCSFVQLHSSSPINCGPANHLDLLQISDRVILRVPSCVGFRGPGQNYN